jgi:hypothetical protein
MAGKPKRAGQDGLRELILSAGSKRVNLWILAVAASATDEKMFTGGGREA